MVKLQGSTNLGGFGLNDSINLGSFGLQYTEANGGTAGLVTTTVTNPAGGAINTAMLDAYSAVIITTTTTTTDQTIGTPTNTSATKRFTIINKSTSTNAIRVNGKFIYPGMAKYFVWDGSVWAGGDGDVEGIDFLTPETGTRFYIPYSAVANITTSASPTIDRVYYIPYITRQELVVSSITIAWTVGDPGSNVAMGIYESNANGLPTNLLGESGHISTAAASGNATYTFSPNLVIPNNKTIWLAFASTSSAITIRYLGVASIVPILGFGAGSSTPYTHFRTVLTPGWTNFPNPASTNTGDYIPTTSSIPALTLGLINQG